jgi:hypothetical protein
VQEFNLIQKEFIAVKETQLHEFMSIVGCEIASILLINDRTSELVFLVDDSKWISIPMTQGLAAHCVRSGEMLNIPDAYADSRFNRYYKREALTVWFHLPACPCLSLPHACMHACCRALSLKIYIYINIYPCI